MSLLKFHFPANQSPPDRFRHTCPDGYKVIADERDLWFRKIREHHEMNGMPLAENWKELAEDGLCRILPPGLCRFADGSNPETYINARLTIDDVGHGMRVLLSIMTDPDPLVDQATADARARTCASCPANVSIQGCSSCAQIADMIASVRGTAKTEADSNLRSCAVCKCSNRAQVWIKPHILVRGVSPDMMNQFATLPHCWKYQELKALETPA